MIKKFLSPDAARRMLGRVWSRFPFSLCWLAAIALWSVLVIWDVLDFREEVSWCLAEGFLLSLAIAVWTEFLDKKRLAPVAQLVAVALVIVDGLVLAFGGGIHSESTILGHAALVTALGVAIVFLPVSRRCDTKRLWLFTVGQCGEIAASLCLAVVMLIAGAIIYVTIDLLFSYSLDKAYGTWSVLGGLCLPLLFFLGKVVDVDRMKYESAAGYSLVAGFCRNVFLPLTALYALILYVYAAKILFTWQLPDGQVCWMVTGLMCAVLVLVYGLQAVSYNPESKPLAVRIAGLASRWFPVAMLPLLVLMSVGIIYRINEYGITAQRLYVSAFNLWAYAVVVYLVVRREKAVLNRVAMSFAIIFVLVSVIPGMNFISIANGAVRAGLMRTFDGKTLPMTVPELESLFAAMPEKEARDVASRLEYLDSWDDHSLVSDIVRSDSKLTVWSLMSGRDSDEATAVRVSFEYSGNVEIPEGYNAVRYGNIDISSWGVDTLGLYDHASKREDAAARYRSADGDSVAVIVRASLKRMSRPDSVVIRDVRGYVFTRQ